MPDLHKEENTLSNLNRVWCFQGASPFSVANLRLCKASNAETAASLSQGVGLFANQVLAQAVAIL